MEKTELEKFSFSKLDYATFLWKIFSPPHTIIQDSIKDQLLNLGEKEWNEETITEIRDICSGWLGIRDLDKEFQDEEHLKYVKEFEALLTSKEGRDGDMNRKLAESIAYSLKLDISQLENQTPRFVGIDDGGKRISYGEGKAIREPSDGKGRFDLITPFGLARLARWYELGAKKYSDRNWEKGGIPFSRYLDSALRHLNKFTMGMTDEDHLAAAAWNILCIIHHQECGDIELDDMPHYLEDGNGPGREN